MDQQHRRARRTGLRIPEIGRHRHAVRLHPQHATFGGFRQRAVAIGGLGRRRRPVAFEQRRGIGAGRHALLVVMTYSTVTRSEEHTSELQSLMRTSYAVFCLTKKQDKAEWKQ